MAKRPSPTPDPASAALAVVSPGTSRAGLAKIARDHLMRAVVATATSFETNETEEVDYTDPDGKTSRELVYKRVAVPSLLDAAIINMRQVLESKDKYGNPTMESVRMNEYILDMANPREKPSAAPPAGATVSDILDRMIREAAKPRVTVNYMAITNAPPPPPPAPESSPGSVVDPPFLAPGGDGA